MLSATMQANKINILILCICYVATAKQSQFKQLSIAANSKCSISEFSCANGKCISLAQFCDNNNDCGDNSDEPRFCSRKYN